MDPPKALAPKETVTPADEQRQNRDPDVSLVDGELARRAIAVGPWCARRDELQALDRNARQPIRPERLDLDALRRGIARALRVELGEQPILEPVVREREVGEQEEAKR